METVDLLEKMKISIDTMTTGEKLLGSIQVTILGLVIVFAALAILYFAIIAMEKLVNNSQGTAETAEWKPDVTETAVLEDEVPTQEHIEEDTTDNTELVAVITAAIAAGLHVPAQDVVIKRIKRIQDPTPAWAKAGRMEQINNML